MKYRVGLILGLSLVMALLGACSEGSDGPPGGDGSTASRICPADKWFMAPFEQPNAGPVTSAPYLLGIPLISSTPSGTDAGLYDITVTINATGPTGVASADLWAKNCDTTDPNTPMHMDFVQTGTSTEWKATSDTWFPLQPGQWVVDSLNLYDVVDHLATPDYKNSWYAIFPNASEVRYYITQTDTTLADILINYGLVDTLIGTNPVP